MDGDPCEATTTMRSSTPSTRIAWRRGIGWARRLREIMQPTSPWPWPTERGLELAKGRVADLVDDVTPIESLASVALDAATKRWASWQRSRVLTAWQRRGRDRSARSQH